MTSIPARVAELADALDLGSSGQPWGFESPLAHLLGCPDLFPTNGNAAANVNLH
jgi:hypothetical protein